MIKIIAAVSANGIVGVDNKIPWHYSADMRHFKKLTTNSIIIMGRKTFESIGKPLPNRENVVITSSTLNIKDITTFKSLSNAIHHLKSDKDIWLIGGTSIWQESMKYAKEIHLTITPNEINDKDAVKFPWINPNMFSLYQNELLEGDNRLDYVIYRSKDWWKNV